MATTRGNELAREIRFMMEELKKVCEGVDESAAGRAPAGRWSPKMILSHLAGPEPSGHLPLLRAFLDQDTPTLDLDAENPFFSPGRSGSNFNQLLSEVEREYDRIARFASELSEDQLDRRAHIPELASSPLGEYPSLDNMLSGLGQYHLKYHIDHLHEVLRDLSEQK